MKIVVIFFTLSFSLVCNNGRINNEETFNLERIIIQNKSGWGIDRYKKEYLHYFDLKIDHCFKGLIAGTSGKPITFLLYDDDSCKVIIEEITFKNNASLKTAYEMLSKEADNVRKGSRDTFGDVCYELREAQFFYALQKGKSLYLISDGNSYNYRYKGGNDSVDAITKEDQNDKNELVYDDVARLIEIYRQ
jgi:hypothetical protein